MEGGGETVVAVVQELKDSGLAVTVVGTRVQHSQKPRKKVPVTKSSVKTNTEIAKRTACAQISDGHYTSSYQLAHCHVRPSSPPPNLPEFPVQRRAPSRIKGNFKPVGCFGCGEMSTSTGFRQQRRRDFNSRIGEYHQSPSRSLASDSFVDSLRKYPLPAGRSASTELVQRLLNYTQAKHSTNISTRSARSLTNRPSRKTKRKSFYKQPGRASKNIQTYTRTVNETPNVNSRNKRNRRDSPMTDHLSETYNYLKAALSGIRSYNGHSPEIRYLNEVKNYIKSTIRQLTDQPAICCPTVQTRYDEHRRLHHKMYTDSTTSPISKESDVNPGPSKDTPTVSDCKRNSFCIDTPSSIAICPYMLGRYRNHRRVLHGEDADDNINEAVGTQADVPTAACYNRNDFGIGTTSSLTICPYALSRYRKHRKQFHKDDVNEAVGTQVGGKSFCVPPPQTNRSCSFFSLRRCPCSKKNMATESEKRQKGKESVDVPKKLTDEDVERVVSDWLAGLPVYINSSPENQKRYRKMASNLVNHLKDILKEENGDEKAMEKILDFLNKLPTDEIDPDDIKKVVSEWLENVHFNETDKDLPENIVNSLLPILRTGGNKDELINKIKQQIEKMLPELEPDEVENLVKKLNDIIERRQNKSEESRKSTISRQPVSDWLETLDTVPKELKEEIQREAKETDNKLNQLFFQQASDESIANEINKFFDILPEEEIPLSTEQKKELISNFTNSIQYPNVLKLMTEKEEKTLARNLLSNLKTKPKHMSGSNHIESSDMFQNISNIPKDTKVRNKEELQNFEKKPQQFNSRNASEDIINTEISDFLKNLSGYGIHLTQSEQSQLAKNIFSQAKSKKNIVNNPTEFWLENSPNISEEIKMKNRDLVKDFDAKLQDLKSQDASDDEIVSTILDFINSLPEKGIIISPKEKFELTKRLISKPLDISKPNNLSASNWLENAPNISEEMKRKNKYLFKKIDNKLQQLKADNANDDVVQEEVNNFLSSLPGNGIKLSSSQKSQLSNYLTNQTHPIQSDKAENWLNDAPNISEEAKRKNKTLFKNFDNNLQQLKAGNADDDVILEEVNNFISSLPSKGIQLSPSQKSQFSNYLTNQTNPIHSDKAEDWLNDAPNISEEAKRKNKTLFKNFDNNLQQLKAGNADDDVILEEVNNFISSLPSKGIQLSPSQKSQFSNYLTNQTNPIHSDKAEDWLKDAPNISEEAKRKNKTLFKHFDNNLQQLKAGNAVDDVIEEEVNNFISSLPSKGIKLSPSQKSQLSNYLTNQTNPIHSDKAEDWLKDAPNISEEAKRKNKTLFKHFDNNLQQLKAGNAVDDVIEEEVNNFISSLPSKGIKLSPSQKSQLSNYLTNQTNPIQSDKAEDWLKDAPNICEETKRKNKMLFKNFDKKLQQLKSNNADDDVIEEEVNNFLSSLPSRGIKLSPLQKSQLSDNLTNQTNPLQSGNAEGWLKNAPNISEETKRNNNMLFKNFDKKLQQLKSNNADDDVIEEEVNNFLSSLPSRGIKLSPSQKSQLSDNLTNQTNPTQSNNAENWLKNAPNISEEAKRKNKMLFKNFDNKLQQLKSNNADDDVIEEEVNNFLSSLPSNGIKLSPSQKSQLSDSLVNQNKPIQSDNAENWLNNTPNIFEEAKIKCKTYFKSFDKKLQQMKADNVGNDAVQEEVNGFLNSLPGKGIKLSPSQKRQLSDSLTNQVNSKPGKILLDNAKDWLENAPNMSEEAKIKNNILNKKFDKKIKPLKSQNANDDVLEEEMNEFINTLPSKGISLTPALQKQLTKTLIGQNTKSDSASSRSTENWLPKVYGDRKNNNKNFDKRKAQQSSYQNYNFDVGDDKINECVEALRRKGITLTPSQISSLANSLKNESIDRPDHVKRQQGEDGFDNEPAIHHTKNNIRNKPQTTRASKQSKILCDYGEEKDHENIVQSSQRGQNRVTNQIKQKTSKTSNFSVEREENWPGNSLSFSNNVKRKDRKFYKKKKSHILGGEDDDDDLEIESISPKRLSQQGTDIPKYVTQTPYQRYKKLGSEQYKEDEIIPEKTKTKNMKRKSQQTNTRRVDNSVTESEAEERLQTKKRIPSAPSQDSRFDDISRLERHESPYPNEHNILSTDQQKARSISDSEIKRQIIRKLKNIGFSDSEAAKLATKLIIKNKNISPISSDYTSPVTSSKKNRTQSPPERVESKRPLNRSDFITSTPRKVNGRFIPKKEGQISSIYYDSDNNSDVENARMGRPKSKLKNKFNEFDVVDNDNARKRKSKLILKELAVDDDDDEYKDIESNNARKRKSKYRPTKYNAIDDVDVDIDYERKRNSKYRPTKQNDNDDKDVDISYARKRKSQYRPIEDNDDDDLDVDIDYERKRKSKDRPKKHNDDDDDDVDLNYSRKINSQYKPVEDNEDYDLNVDYTRKRNSRYESTDINHNHIDDDVDYDNASKTKTKYKSTGVNFNGNYNVQEFKYSEPKNGNKTKEPGTKTQFTSKQNMEKLGDLIKSWINSAVPNLNDEEMIKAMIEELVTSVVDRKTDLQKNNFSLSNQEEIKYLCNKIADWLTKYVDEEDLPTTMEVKDLTNKIHGISQIRESHEDIELPDSLNTNDIVDKWVHSLPLSFKGSTEQLNLKKIVDEFKNKINLIGQKNEPGLKNEIKNFLENIPLKFENSGQKVDFLNEKVDQLVDGLKGTALIPETFVKDIVDEWAKSCTLSKSNSITSDNILKKAKADLVKTLTNDVLNANQMTPKKVDEIFQDATQNFFRQLPSHPYKKDDINIAATKLKNMFKIHSEKYPSVFPEPDRRKAADLLLSDIEQWVQNLPIESNSPEDEKKSQASKQHTLTKLIHKIGELNMNPEIYVDDFVYKDMLGDEVDNLLSNIPSENIKREHSKLKREFLNILRRARQKFQEENAVQEYKQKLRVAIEKTLPDTALSKDGEALLEVLKENTIDTFINMHYVGDDLQELTRLKNKISDEIYKFCDDQIKRCPAVPIDTRKLNENLYYALESVSEPENDYFRNEVELVKLKDEINNWINELPLKTRSGEDKLQTNKMISVLAKKLYDFENMKLLHSGPDQDYDDSMKKEIVQFLKKLPFTPDYNNDVDINQFTETLVKNLKDTLGLRRLNSGTRRSINFKDSCICFGAWIPPSTLSKDDQEHLEQIRNRATGLKPKIPLKDVAGFPCPIDACSQTEIKTSSVGACPIRSRWLVHRNSSAQTSCKRMQAMGSQADLSTRISDLCDRTCVQPQGPSFVLPQDSTPCSPLRTPRPNRADPISSDDFEPRVKHQFSDRFNPPCPKPFYNGMGTRALERNRNTQRTLTKEEMVKEEKRCRCVTNCGKSNVRRKSCHLRNVDSMNSCSKCCGVHCPYPSYLFFR